MSGHERRRKVTAAEIPGAFPQTLNPNDYNLTNIKDDGWCLYNAFLRPFNLQGSENARKLACIVADKFAEEMKKEASFFDLVVGNSVKSADGETIEGITGVASQDPAKPGKPYIEVGEVKRAVIFEDAFIDSITRLRIPGMIDSGPIAYPESQGFFIILNDLFPGIRPVFYKEEDGILTLQTNYVRLNASPKDNTYYVFIKYNNINHFDSITPTTNGSLIWSRKIGSRALTQAALNSAYQSSTCGSKDAGPSSSNSASSASSPVSPFIAPENLSTKPIFEATGPWGFYKLLLQAAGEEVSDKNAWLVACAITSYIRDKREEQNKFIPLYVESDILDLEPTQAIAGLTTPINRKNLEAGPVVRPTNINGISAGLIGLFPKVTFSHKQFYSPSVVVNPGQTVQITFNQELTQIVEMSGSITKFLASNPRCTIPRDGSLHMMINEADTEIIGKPPTLYDPTVTTDRLSEIVKRLYPTIVAATRTPDVVVERSPVRPTGSNSAAAIRPLEEEGAPGLLRPVAFEEDNPFSPRLPEITLGSNSSASTAASSSREDEEDASSGSESKTGASSPFINFLFNKGPNPYTSSASAAASSLPELEGKSEEGEGGSPLSSSSSSSSSRYSGLAAAFPSSEALFASEEGEEGEESLPSQLQPPEVADALRRLEQAEDQLRELEYSAGANTEDIQRIYKTIAISQGVINNWSTSMEIQQSEFQRRLLFLTQRSLEAHRQAQAAHGEITEERLQLAAEAADRAILETRAQADGAGRAARAAEEEAANARLLLANAEALAARSEASARRSEALTARSEALAARSEASAARASRSVLPAVAAATMAGTPVVVPTRATTPALITQSAGLPAYTKRPRLAAAAGPRARPASEF